MFFDVLSNVVGVSGDKGVECHVLGCRGNVNLCDDVTDRPTDVRLCAPFSTPTA